MKLLRRLLLLCLAVLLLAAGLLACVLYTETGLRWALAALDGRLPFELEVGDLEGRLAGPLTLTDVHYGDPGVQVGIARLSIDWQPRRLLDSEFRILRLRVEQIAIVTTPAPAEPADEAFALPGIRLPFAVSLEQAMVTDLSVRSAEDTELFGAGRISTALAFDGETLAMRQLDIEAPAFSLSLQGELTPSDHYPLSLSGGYSIKLQNLAPVSGQLELSGDLQQLGLRHHTLTPLKSQLVATLSDLFQTPSWDARLQVEQFDATQFNPDWEAVTLQGSARSQGSLEGYRFDLDAAVRGARVPEGNWTLNGGGTATTLEVERLHGATAAGTLSGKLKLEDLDGRPRWDAALEVEQLDTAGLDPAWEALTLEGTVHSQGSLDDYRFELDTRVQGTRVPQGHWTLSGSGTTKDVAVQQLRGETLGGIISGDLNVQLAPHLAWRFNSEGSAIDPGLYSPDWPGKVDFAVTGKGSREKERYHAEAELKQLSGTLVQYPLEASGKLSADSDGFVISALDVSAAGARLNASGSLTDRWALGWSLDAPDLSALAGSAAGSLTASGELAGPRDNPGVTLKLDGKQLAFEHQRVESLLLTLDWSPDDARPSRLDLQAADLLLSGQRVARLKAQGSGLASAHEVDLQLEAEALKFAGGITGGYTHREHSWQGVLSAANLALEPGGDWLMVEPALLQASGQRASVSALCLTSRVEGRVCVDGSWTRAAGWHAKLLGEALPLALLDPLLPADLNLDGKLKLAAQAQQTEAGKVAGELNLASPGGGVRYRAENREPLSLDYRDLVLSGQLQDGVARLRTRAQLEQPQGRLDGRLELPISALDPPSRRIEGKLTADISDMSLLAALVPVTDAVKGSLAVDLAVRGSVEQPDIDLDLALQEGEISLPAQGITLRDISLHAEPDGAGNIAFRGGVRSGEGRVELDGSLAPGTEGEWRVAMAVRGEGFEAISVPEYRVLVSPDLKLELDPASAQVSGAVLIPEARLRPKQLSGATRPSRDVVIVSGDSSETAGYAVTSNVRLELGERISFDGFGLKARFTGNVVILDAPGQLTSGTGELQIRDGSYKAYGQDLKIERGRLILVGGPVDNPGLDIRAVREVGDVTAGLHVTGELQEPRIAVFSDPAMSETEALSYLVLGRPLPQDDAEESDQLNAASAALALGVAGAGLLGGDLGEQVGIDEVGVERESATGDVTLKLGTYLTPDLYVGYGRGLASQINSFLVRYRLTKRLSVETESSSEATGGDLIYTIERP